jgi:hypothetical protein
MENDMLCAEMCMGRSLLFKGKHKEIEQDQSTPAGSSFELIEKGSVITSIVFMTGMQFF